MKNCLCFALLLFIFNSCSKSPDIDPRNQYLGEYNVIVKIVFTSDNGTPVIVNKAGINTVVKGTESNEIAFIDNGQHVTATLSGTTFTMGPVESPIDKGYVTTGSGSFSKNSFTLKTSGKGGSNTYPTEITMTGTKK